MRLYRILKNKLLLKLGYKLVNSHGHTVRLHKGKQIKSNPLRKNRDYSMDDKGWRVL